MFPANVMNFMKKMAQPDSGNIGSVTPEDSGTTFGGKLRQLGSDLIMATGNVAKLGPTKPAVTEDTQKEETTTTETPKSKFETGGKVSSGDECRVCRKCFGPDEVSKTCCECQQRVCEDCASYSTTTNSDDPSSWRCSVCRRKIASRDQPILTQESTDSLLEVPMLEALQRRHSEARLGGQTGTHIGTLGTGLAPPRSPELRRHSDVSPASLKELEKIRKGAGERCEELRRDRELDRKSKSRATSPDRHAHERIRGPSPQKVGIDPSSVSNEGMPIEPQEEEEIRRRAQMGGTGRKTRMSRQRSYDDEMKMPAMGAGPGGPHPHLDAGLGPPVMLPRRASAYDVYAPPGSPGMNSMGMSTQQRGSISGQGGRKPDERPRRSSFRAVKPILPYDVMSDDKKILPMDPVPVCPPPVVQPPIMIPDEKTRSRRRGSLLPNIDAIKSRSAAGVGPNTVAAPAVSRVAAEDRELPRQGSLVDGNGIKIVIHRADNDMTSWINPERRLKLRRDPTLEKGHRSGGFGMRVVGGKTEADGRTFAYIVWVLPDGPAAKAKLQRGDKVLEWNGVPLINRSFEEVAQIIDRPDDVVELVVEHTTDMVSDLPDDIGFVQQSGKVPPNLGLFMEPETDKASSSSTRRKLPKTPEEMAKEKQVSGRVQIQISYDAERKELIVSVFMADDLCLRDDTYRKPPEAYARLVLVPACDDRTSAQTSVAEPSQKPIWNDTLCFHEIDGEALMNSAIDVTLWDAYPDGDNVFLGECTVVLQQALEHDRAVWYPLGDPRGLRSGKSPYASPRGSFSMETAQRLLRKTESRERSYSDDTQSDSGSPEFGYLHPDHAWHANSRRGSSQSEQLEVETYELNRNYSRSLPGSRRSSFQSQGGTDSKRGSIGDADPPPVMHYNRNRRRSSTTRPIRDHAELLDSLRSVKLGRTMSLSGDKARESRRGERKESVMDIPEKFYERNSESDEEEKWSQPTRNENGVDLKLGRGQVSPKTYKMTAALHGEVKLGFCLSKGTLEVEVICARDICAGEKEDPDTYVKTYLRDDERWLQKRKTRVTRHSKNPQYRQTIKYSSCNALGRNLLVMLWEKKQGFESNRGLGGAEVNLDSLPLTQLTMDWYPLFPIHTLGTHTADSP